MENTAHDALLADSASPVTRLAARLGRKSLLSDTFSPANGSYVSGDVMLRHQSCNCLVLANPGGLYDARPLKMYIASHSTLVDHQQCNSPPDEPVSSTQTVRMFFTTASWPRPELDSVLQMSQHHMQEQLPESQVTSMQQPYAWCSGMSMCHDTPLLHIMLLLMRSFVVDLHGM